MRCTITLCLTLGCLAAGVAADRPAPRDRLPLGHPDFYPSPERPVGWRGDGTGSWPGARVVTDWDAASMKNVAWKVDTPGAGLAQPIVAGEKVFVTGDPNELYCYNVHDGALLWRVAIDHTLKMPPAEREAARQEQAFWDGRWQLYATWRYRLRELEKKVPAVRDLLVREGQSRRFPNEGDKQYVAILAAIGTDGEAKALFLDLHRAAKENGWLKQDGNNGHMLDKKTWPLAKRYEQAQRKWDVLYHAYNNWLGYTTQSFATPVTDGELVYTTSANYAVAAVDFSGGIRWLVWEHLPDQAGLLHTRHVASPRLCDGKLVVNHAGHLRAYEAATGRKLWEVFGPSAVAGVDKPQRYYPRSDPESTSPVVGLLPIEGGGSVGVIWDGDGRLWRLDDGKLLVKGPPDGTSGTDYLLADRGILLHNGGARRLVARSRDEIEVSDLWSSGKVGLSKFSSVTFAGGKVLGGTTLFEVATGRTANPFQGSAKYLHSKYNSSISTGDHIYAFNPGEKGIKDLGDNVDGIISCGVAPVAGGKITNVASAAIDTRMHGDSEWAVLNKTHGWGYQQNSSPSAQANRLFFRCRGVLWCIGSGAFPVPKDCPDHARVR